MNLSSNLKKLAVLAVAGTLTATGVTSAAAIEVRAVAFNPDAKGSLTIHKHFGDEGKAGDGREDTTIDTGKNPPLSGVKFKIEKVTNVDLKTNNGWKEAEKISKAPETAKLGDAKEGTTDEKGVFKFSDLAVGLYKVTEVDNSKAKKNGQGDPVKAKMAAPFFVTIPLTNPQDRNDWLYDVHAYPKNQDFQVNKEGKLITSDNPGSGDTVNAGDTMEYTVTATLPALAEGKKYEKYNLIDQLSANHDIKTFKVTKVEAITDEKDNNPTTLEAANYDVDNTSKATENRALVKFNSTGLAKLADVSKTGKKMVRYTYTVKIKSDFKAGDLDNKAYVTPSNEYSDEPKPGDNTPSGENKEKFVQFQIEKQDGSETTKKLEGAKFDLYACTDQGKFADKDGNAVDAKEKAMKIASVTTAGKEGKTEAIRMPVTSDPKSNVKKICAVETKAPDGYSLLVEPVVFSIDYKDNTTTTPVVQTIDNVKHNAGFKLPFTGAQGLVVLTAAGVVLIMGAIMLTARSRKTA